MKHSKSKNENSSKIKSIYAPVKARINLAIVVSAISVITKIATLLTMAFLAQELIYGTASLSKITPLLITMLALSLTSAYSKLKANDISHFAAFDLELILRTRLAKHIASMPLGEIYRLGQGALTKSLLEDVKGTHAYVADAPPLIARAIIAPIVIIATLTVLNWKLTIFLVILVAIVILIFKSAFPNLQEIMQKFNTSKEKMSTSVIELVQAMPIVKIFDNGTSSINQYKKSLLAHKTMVQEWHKQTGLGHKLVLSLSNSILVIIGVLFGGFYLWSQQQLEFAHWVAVLMIGTSLIEFISPLMFLMSSIQKSKASISKILEIENIAVLPISEQKQNISNYGIEFNNVSFQYNANAENEKLALNNINFSVKENTFTAIVGASGSGKSTLARLIPRFWDVTQGDIKIGGINIKDIPPEQLMSCVSFVFQDNFLFHDSIANNISYGLTNVTTEDIVNAAKKAQAHQFINQLPDGYNTIVGERGSTLSGGQRQRITIARAFLQDRPILILDEATAHADPENEALLIQAIAQLIKSKTVIMIAHRLSTIRDANQILVLEQGRIVEQGKHQQLMDKQQNYYQLWQAYEKTQAWQLASLI